MIKLIIFDLDGVLVDAKKIHFDALNCALDEVDNKFIISENEHYTIYDGLKTSQKLKILTQKKGLSESLHKQIWSRKQELTIEYISKVEENSNLVKLLKHLKGKGYLIACCSNSIRRSVLIMLSKLGLIEYLDLILSNEDVKNSKPNPEIYWKAMKTLDVLPEETIIVEDSPVGLLSAQRSSANVVRVNSPKEVNLEIIEDIINQKTEKNLKWVDKKLNVLVPMAGEGSRFKEHGYKVPKPLIDINGKLMIQRVVESLNLEANFIYVVQKSHNLEYNLNTILNLITPNCKIVEVDGLTEGAACSTLLAKELFDNKNPLMIVNSDQFIEWNSSNFYYKMNEENIDGGIVTFDSSETKWSYVKISDGYVIETAEKNPISNDATVGIYYWKKGSDYVKSAENMISKNIRVNNEFYICPVYNEAINDGKLFSPYKVNEMWGLGTPEDLKFYLENFNN